MPSFPNRCQHIKVNGTQCECPALRRNKFCYFHKRHHDERIQLNADRARRRNSTIDLPVLEDANSIQVSLMQIMRLIVAGQIDTKTAGLLLYALQIASVNLPRTSFEARIHDIVLDPAAVNQTPLSAHIWDDSDFRTDDDDEQDEAATRAAALEEAKRKAGKKAELERWAEAEANRLTELGRRQAAARDQEEACIEAQTQNPTPARRPPAHVNMDEVRKHVTDQIRAALPDIAAAQSERRNGHSSG